LLKHSKNYYKNKVVFLKKGIKFIMSTKVVSGKNLGDSAEITYEPVSGG
jgi:hypothetical protein